MKVMFTADITREKFRLYYHLDSEYGLIDTPQPIRKEWSCYCFYHPLVVFDDVQYFYRLITKSRNLQFTMLTYLCKHIHTRMYIFIFMCISDHYKSSLAFVTFKCLRKINQKFMHTSLVLSVFCMFLHIITVKAI